MLHRSDTKLHTDLTTRSYGFIINVLNPIINCTYSQDTLATNSKIILDTPPSILLRLNFPNLINRG